MCASTAQSHSYSRRVTICALLCVSSICFLWRDNAASAIDLGPGIVTFDFSTAPLPTDFSTVRIYGYYSSINDQAAQDASIQFLSASTIPGALPETSTIPPQQRDVFRYNSTGGYLQSNPTAVQAAVLLATLTNGSSHYIDAFNVTYDLTVTGNGPEEIPHHSVYFSTSGSANSWTRIADPGVTGPVTLSFSGLGTSFGSDPAYLLWVDDNATASGVDNEFSYVIDNMTFNSTLGGVKVPDFGDFQPVQTQDFEGGGLPVHGAEQGTIVTANDGPEAAANNSLRVNAAVMSVVTELVDVRGFNGRPKVALDLKAWHTSQGSDFEARDQIIVTAEYSYDGFSFQSEDVVRLHGADPIQPFDPLVPNPADQISAAFPDSTELSPYNHYELRLPAGVQSLRLRATLDVDSTSEFAAIDNITIFMNPEPSSAAMICLGMLGLVGYRVRQRFANGARR